MSLTFPTPTQKQVSLDRVREAERCLSALREKLESLRMHEHPAYVLSIHTSKMLAKMFESMDCTPAETVRYA